MKKTDMKPSQALRFVARKLTPSRQLLCFALYDMHARKQITEDTMVRVKIYLRRLLQQYSLTFVPSYEDWMREHHKSLFESCPPELRREKCLEARRAWARWMADQFEAIGE